MFLRFTRGIDLHWHWDFGLSVELNLGWIWSQDFRYIFWCCVICPSLISLNIIRPVSMSTTSHPRQLWRCSFVRGSSVRPNTKTWGDHSQRSDPPDLRTPGWTRPRVG